MAWKSHRNGDGEWLAGKHRLLPARAEPQSCPTFRREKLLPGSQMRFPGGTTEHLRKDGGCEGDIMATSWPSDRCGELFLGGVGHAPARQSKVLPSYCWAMSPGPGRRARHESGAKLTAISLFWDSLLNPLCDALNFSFLL